MAITPVLLLLASTAAPAVPAPADPLEKIRCVREQVTGSLVSVRKVCHSEREWRSIRDSAEGEARRITQPGTLNQLNGS